MGEKNKKLCKLKKEFIKNNLNDFKELVSSPNYLCRKCGRVARQERYLCKVVSL